MKIKHKLLADYQYVTSDKKIFLIKSGTIIEEYLYKLKDENIPIDRDIVEANPQLFQPIDWKAELLTYIKTNKLPTPAVLTKKLIPFIEEMVLSTIQQNTKGKVVDDSVFKELERKEDDLNSREKRIKEKEDEIDIRLKRVEKREGEYKNDLKLLDKKEDDLREKSKEIIEKQLDLDDKLQDLNEKERNLDRATLESSKEIDEKYIKLQNKIDEDLKSLSEREKEVESKIKDISKREEKLSKFEGSIQDKVRNYDILKDELEIINSLLSNMNNTLDNLENTNGLDGFVSDVTKNHIKLKSENLRESISKIDNIIKKVS